MSAVSELLDAAELPVPDPPTDVAQQLVLVAHRCVDWDTWGGQRALRYWDALADRVRGGCYAGPTLTAWWNRMVVSMGLQPPRREDRDLLLRLLDGQQARPVLAVLRAHADTVVLRVRVAVDAARQTRPDVHPTPVDLDPEETLL